MKITAWVLGILGIALLGMLSDVFLSEKKLGKFMRGVFGSLTVLFVIAPLPALIGGDFDCDGINIGSELVLDENYLNGVNRQKAAVLESATEEALAQRGYKGVKLHISGNFLDGIEITSVRADLSSAVIDSSGAHINIKEKAAQTIAEILNIDASEVVVYE